MKQVLAFIILISSLFSGHALAEGYSEHMDVRYKFTCELLKSNGKPAHTIKGIAPLTYYFLEDTNGYFVALHKFAVFGSKEKGYDVELSLKIDKRAKRFKVTSDKVTLNRVSGGVWEKEVDLSSEKSTSKYKSVEDIKFQIDYRRPTLWSFSGYLDRSISCSFSTVK